MHPCGSRYQVVRLHREWLKQSRGLCSEKEDLANCCR
jgi:hypothetical protein